MSTVAYIRVSTARQADSGLGLEAQISRIQQFSELNNIEIAETIVDAGISGRTMNRDGLQQLLSGVAEGRFTRVIVSSADRLTRSCRDFLALVNGPLRDVELIAAHMVTSLTEDVEFAERESEEISRRTSEALSVLKAQGRRVGNLPLGQTVTESGEIIDNEAEQEIINKVRTKRAEGTALDALVEWCQQEEITARSGLTPSRSTIANWIEGVELVAQVKRKPMPPRKPRRKLEETPSCIGLTDLIRDLHKQGLSLRAIAAEVSQRGYLNSKGNAFHAQNIKRIIERLEGADHAERR